MIAHKWSKFVTDGKEDFMSSIKFYSEFDMACGWELKKIVERIKENAIDNDLSILDVMEFYNTLKYLDYQRFKEYIAKETEVDIDAFIKTIKRKIGIFLNQNKDNYLELYDEIDFNYHDDYFDIFEAYKIYEQIDSEKFGQFLDKNKVHLQILLRNRKLVNSFDEVVKKRIKEDPIYAETILVKYLNEEDLYLPPALAKVDIDQLLIDYIQSRDANINQLRKIFYYPSNNDLIISDKIKLIAQRRIKEEEEKIFSGGSGLTTGVGISYPVDQTEVVKVDMNGMETNVSISRRWIEENLDFNTLWNNFIYVFNFFDSKMRLTLDSKRSECGVLESIMHPNAEHLYIDSFSFKVKEMLSSGEIISYIEVLKIFGVRFENIIEWFFHKYLPEEFNVNDFIVKMPSENAPYFEKCRTILPEIDRVLKQYNMFVEDGFIEQELLQMSSSHLFLKDCNSLNKRKYIYPSSEWYKTAAYLLFSDQSSIFYLPHKEEKFKNFFDLMISEKVKIEEFQEYQVSRMKWLFDNDLVRADSSGYLYFCDELKIIIIKELFYNEVINYWHYSIKIREQIDDFLSKGLVCEESSLLSRNEQDYLNYYLNKSKFSNGRDIRNRYLHGTNTNNEEQYKMDYYTIIKLLVVIIIKINDDLCISKDYVDTF